MCPLTMRLRSTASNMRRPIISQRLHSRAAFFELLRVSTLGHRFAECIRLRPPQGRLHNNGLVRVMRQCSLLIRFLDFLRNRRCDRRFLRAHCMTATIICLCGRISRDSQNVIVVLCHGRGTGLRMAFCSGSLKTTRKCVQDICFCSCNTQRMS